MTLNTKQRKALKAKAHHLKPVVRVGQKGVSDNLLAETSQALETHALIKIHIADDDRDRRSDTAQTIATACDAELLQQIGKTYLLYREKTS